MTQVPSECMAAIASGEKPKKLHLSGSSSAISIAHLIFASFRSLIISAKSLKVGKSPIWLCSAPILNQYAGFELTSGGETYEHKGSFSRASNYFHLARGAGESEMKERH
mmetsp:Transcript_11216/g.15657  ORF Transcript_11216/g.15657 Transcript_11216/m.15657 type:complete len:109 (+) Transcript_11216:848-1174(+)